MGQVLEVLKVPVPVPGGCMIGVAVELVLDNTSSGSLALSLRPKNISIVRFMMTRVSLNGNLDSICTYEAVWGVVIQY